MTAFINVTNKSSWIKGFLVVRAERRRIRLRHLHGGGSHEGAAINYVYRSLYVAPFIYIYIYIYK